MAQDPSLTGYINVHFELQKRKKPIERDSVQDGG